MTKIRQITKHGQEQLLFTCSNCKNTVAIDTYDLLQKLSNLLCK